MKMERNWIVLGLLAVTLVLVTGCSSQAPAPVAPPPTVDTAPKTTDVDPNPTPAKPVDVTEPTPEPTIEELQADLERQGLLGDVFYDFDKYELRPEARDRLAKNAEFMKSAQGRSLKFKIEGHCDERGTNEYNLALGQKRTSTSLDYLISLGIDRSRFKTVSYGEERPFCTESNEACWQRNRRARFVITGR